MNRRDWNWMDGGVLPLFLSIIRALWLAPWILLIQQWLAPERVGALFPIALLIGLPFISLLLARAFSPQVSDEVQDDQRTDWGASIPETLLPTISWRARLGVALTGILVLLVILWWQFYRHDYVLPNLAWIGHLSWEWTHWVDMVIPLSIWSALLIAGLWLRGLLDAPLNMTHDRVWEIFVTGLVALGLYWLILSFGFVEAQGNMTWLLIYFGVGMAALALSSLKITVGLDRALGAGFGRSVRRPIVTRYWLFSMSLAIGLLLVLGLALGLLIAPQDIAYIFSLFSGIAQFLGRILVNILLGLAYVAAMILYYLMLLLQPLFDRLAENPLFENMREAMEGLEQEPAPPEGPVAEDEPLAESYRWGGLALAVTIVVLIFAWALRRLRGMLPEDIDETRESIFSADLLQEQLGSLLQNVLGRLKAAGEALNPFLSLEDEPDARRSIRQVYQELLATANDKGLTRLRPQTPLEYQQRLDQGLSVEPDPITAITEGYIEARYAAEPPNSVVVDQVSRAWGEIQETLESRDETARHTGEKQLGKSDGQKEESNKEE